MEPWCMLCVARNVRCGPFACICIALMRLLTVLDTHGLSGDAFCAHEVVASLCAQHVASAEGGTSMRLAQAELVGVWRGKREHVCQLLPPRRVQLLFGGGMSAGAHRLRLYLGRREIDWPRQRRGWQRRRRMRERLASQGVCCPRPHLPRLFGVPTTS